MWMRGRCGWHAAAASSVDDLPLGPAPPSFPFVPSFGHRRLGFFQHQLHLIGARTQRPRKYLAVMRQNWLSNRIFKSFDDIVDHCCYAWNTLIDQPWKIMSIARRDWAAAGHSI
jgi:hypothetical protein